MLKEKWPSYLQELREFDALAVAQQPELDRARQQVLDMALDFSAFTLTEEGIVRWERILGVTGMEADNLDGRRFRIQSRLMEQIPITKRTLHRQLLTLCGEGGFALTINYGAYALGVKVALQSRAALADVKNLVFQCAPANLLLTVDMFNQHQTLACFFHAQLAAYTHQQLRDEVLS